MHAVRQGDRWKAVLFLLTGYLLVSMALVHAQLNLVTDPGFESPVVTTIPILGGLEQFNDTSTPDYLGSSAWYVSAGTIGQPSVTLVNNGILSLLTTPIATTAANQNQYLVLNGLGLAGTTLTAGTQGGISQSFATPGQDYLVTYQAGALGTGTAVLSATVDGDPVRNSFGGGAQVTLTAGTFQNESFTFTASNGTSVVDFSEPTVLASGVSGIAIDNIVITAVPEPRDSMALCLLGGLGLLALRRAQKRFSRAKLSC